MNLDEEARAVLAWVKEQKDRPLGYDDILSEARRRNTGAQARDLRFVTEKVIRMLGMGM